MPPVLPGVFASFVQFCCLRECAILSDGLEKGGDKLISGTWLKQGLIIPWWLKYDTLPGFGIALSFGLVMTLLITSYLQAWLTDAGSVPPGWRP